MALIRNNLVPTLVILVAGLIVSFAVVPLQDTEWAEGFRTEVGAEGVEEGFGEEGEMPGGAIMVILPLIKVSILMGIGALLTALVFVGYKADQTFTDLTRTVENSISRSQCQRGFFGSVALQLMQRLRSSTVTKQNDTTVY